MKDEFDYFRDVQDVFMRAKSTETLGIEPDEAAMIIFAAKDELFNNCVEDYVSSRMDVLEGIAHGRIGTKMTIDLYGLIEQLIPILGQTPEGTRPPATKRLWTKGDPWPPPGVIIPPKNKA